MFDFMFHLMFHFMFHCVSFCECFFHDSDIPNYKLNGKSNTLPSHKSFKPSPA